MQNQFKTLFISLLLLFTAGLFADTVNSEQFVDAAWKSWIDNNQQGAEENFKAAVQEDSTNSRAYIGLAFLYSLQKKDEEAWEVYQKALKYVENPYPYIYAAWSSIRLSNNDDGLHPEVAEFWEKLSKQADSEGILKAMANQFLGGYYERRADFPRSREHYQNINAIIDWTVIGPFDNISASGFDRVFPPEQEYKVDKVYEGKNGIPASWFKIAEVRPDHWIDFQRYFAYDQSVFYGNNFIYSPRKQTVQIRVALPGR